MAAFEKYISKENLAADLDLRSCKAIRGHDKISLLFSKAVNSSKNLSNYYIWGTKNPGFQNSCLVCDY